MLEGRWHRFYALALNLHYGTLNQSELGSLVYRRSHFWNYAWSVRCKITLTICGKVVGPVFWEKAYVEKVRKSRKITESLRQKVTMELEEGVENTLLGANVLKVLNTHVFWDSEVCLTTEYLYKLAGFLWLYVLHKLFSSSTGMGNKDGTVPFQVTVLKIEVKLGLIFLLSCPRTSFQSVLPSLQSFGNAWLPRSEGKH